MRDRGFYWVKHESVNRFEIGYWTGNVWKLLGVRPYQDNNLKEINEEKLVELKEERKAGFYWTCYNDYWSISYYYQIDKVWRTYAGMTAKDAYFGEIDEEMIVRGES